MLSSFREVNFYHVNEKLEICNFSVKENDLVVCIDYFGKPTPREIVRYLKEKSAFVAMDMSQAFFAEANLDADFFIFSPRKFLPVPDGGILISKKELDLELEDSVEWWCNNLLISQRKENWYSRYKENKKNAPVGYFSMSTYTKDLLYKFDLQFVKNKLKENSSFLFSCLKNHSLFPKLDFIPIGFPVVVEKRDALREKLFQNQIFPPIHWEIPHPLSKKIMTLPCDYRYTEKDMRRIINNLPTER